MHSFNPWFGEISWRRALPPTSIFLPGESHGQRGLAGCSPWGHKELDMTEVTWHTCTSPALIPHLQKISNMCPLAALAVRTQAALTNPWAPPRAPRAFNPSLFWVQFIPGTSSSDAWCSGARGLVLGSPPS